MKRFLKKTVPLLAAVCFLFAAYVIFIRPALRVRVRQQEEKELIEVFLKENTKEETENLTEDTPEDENIHRACSEAVTEKYDEAEDKSENGSTEREAPKSSSAPFVEDTVFYERDGKVYTPDYAKGELLAVLTVDEEDVKICRGVYTGTWEEIDYDLDIFMVTAARPDYVLGETHFVIYGHNNPLQDLSFNSLQNMKAGDLFYLTTGEETLKYIVSAVYPMTREKVASDIADNFSLPENRCYIVTCGRREYRYYDFVVEGVREN